MHLTQFGIDGNTFSSSNSARFEYFTIITNILKSLRRDVPIED